MSRRSSRRGSGQGMVEYAMILALVVLAVVAAVTALGGNLRQVFDSTVASLGVIASPATSSTDTSTGSGSSSTPTPVSTPVATPTPSPSPSDDSKCSLVTIAPSVGTSSPYFNEERVTVSNPSAIVNLSLTVTVQRTAGLSYLGAYNTVGGQITQTSGSSSSAITYQFDLDKTSVTPGSWTFAAQTSGTGTSHPTTGDTYKITYTFRGTDCTDGGHF